MVMHRDRPTRLDVQEVEPGVARFEEHLDVAGPAAFGRRGSRPAFALECPATPAVLARASACGFPSRNEKRSTNGWTPSSIAAHSSAAFSSNL